MKNTDDIFGIFDNAFGSHGLFMLRYRNEAERFRAMAKAQDEDAANRLDLMERIMKAPIES